MAISVMQGDSYSLPFVLRMLDGTLITEDLVEIVVLNLGGMSRQYPGDVEYQNGKWMLPVTQEQSFAFKGSVEPQARVQFKGGNIFGGIGRSIRILNSQSRGILPDAETTPGTVTDDIPVEIGAVNGNVSVTVMAASASVALGVIRYDVPQDLTPEQKQQAQENLGIGSGDDKHFTFTQSIASDLWTIQHDLGKYPSVSIVDSSENEVVGDVTYLTKNKLTISFTAPFSGKAYLN